MNGDPRRRAAAELGAALLTGAVFLVFENLLRLKLPFLVAATLGWSGYIAWRLRGDPAEARNWGLRLDTLKPAAALCGVFFVVGAAALGGYRVASGWKPLPAKSWLLFAIYPAWGFIQQFVLQALITTNLERFRLPAPAIVAAASLLFGLAHLPDWPLAGLTAAAGACLTPIFLRTRNLYPLALTHAWLGTLAYYWVLERDPWLEMFPR